MNSKLSAACVFFLLSVVIRLGVADLPTTEPPRQETVAGRPVEQTLRVVHRPRPDLKPEDVVRIQLEALRHNDVNNLGIAHCFEFASPSNRRRTGPLENFIVMLRSPAYSKLLNHRVALIAKVFQRGDHAEVLLSIADEQKQLAVFVFGLSRQQQAPYAGCWMTTSVFELPTASRSKPRAKSDI